MATLILIKNRREIDRIRGAERKGSEDTIVKHAPETELTVKKRRRRRRNARDAGSTDVIAPGDESLLGSLDMRKVNCLNEAQHYLLKSIVEMRTRNTTGARLESDVGEQLLITLPFDQEVKVRSVVLYTKDSKFGPKNIKIDINKLALRFDDFEGTTESTVIQVLEVPEVVVKEGKPIHLRFERLQRVKSLHIFVESNHGNEDVTRIDAIDVYGPGYGEPVASTQISSLRDFLGIHEQGFELLTRFERQGGIQNLSNAIALLRESMHLCPTDHPGRAVPVGTLALALDYQYQQRDDDAGLSEAIALFHELLELVPPAPIIDNLNKALITRYKIEGRVSDLEEVVERRRQALNLYPPGHPDRADSLDTLSGLLLVLYGREGRASDLEEAIENQREAVSLCPPGHPVRAVSLSTLSSILVARYEREGSLLDLEEGIVKQQEALNLRPPGHPDRAASLTSLCGALLSRYERGGRVLDLEKAIEHQREAVDLSPPDHSVRAAALNNLSSVLLTRYHQKGSLLDLEEVIGKQRELLDLHPPGHPTRGSALTSVSSALLFRYKREGRVSDLEEAITKQREALNLSPPGHPIRALCLNNLSHTLVTRYDREGSLLDLEETIEKQREVLNLFPPGLPEHVVALTNLASTLLTRYRREESVSYLEDAIAKQREALNLSPPGQPVRALCLNNLSHALATRYDREGSLLDLEEAIEKQRRGLDLSPPGHQDRALSLTHLSSALLTRHVRAGSLSDLEEATEHRRKILELHPHGHPNRSASLLALCCAYLLAIGRHDPPFIVQRRQALMDEVLTMLREAANHSNSPPLDRLTAALQWIDILAAVPQCIDTSSVFPSLSPGPVALLDAYSTAFDQLDIVLATCSTLASKHTRLSSKELVRCKFLAADAAAYAVQQGDMILAVEFLERGRNLLFAQIGRYRVDLAELQKENAELAKRFHDLSGLLDSSAVSDQPTLEGQTEFEDSIERYRRVASNWDRAVNDIRAVPGFENFLRPPRYTALQAAAGGGPVVIVIPDVDQSHALILLQGRDKPHYVNLPADGGELGALCEDFIEAVQFDDEDDANSRITTLLRSLWVRVVRPIADALENELRCPLHSRIWWCPSSILSFLPLHAAGRYASNADPNENFPAKYVSSYTPTLHALLRARSGHSVSKEKKMLTVAQPDTPGQDWLPSAISEAIVVKILAESKMKMKATLLFSKAGTHDTALNCMADHSWIHLICHGSQDPVNPFDSCFHLYDKELTLRNIMQRGLPDAQFAFLAACHTATGDMELVDEGLHLAAGLQFAGFKSVVGTIWTVADIDGVVIAAEFYKALALQRVGEEGIDCSRAAHALSKAVKCLRDNGVPISRWIRYIHIGM